MAEFIEIMRQARKMCIAQEDCQNCPIWDTAKSFCRLGAACESDDGVTESVVMAWAAEHPEPVYPTWNEWYKKSFQDAYYDGKRICPRIFGGGESCDSENDCDKCRDRPIPANIAEKLGIKPKEAK